MKVEWYRFWYRTLKSWSNFHYRMFHAFSWASYKAYDKAKSGKHGRIRDGVVVLFFRWLTNLGRRK
jgi:hypothetical protein